ncbi:PQQ-dependent sugar dehydrogenase [Luteolibacter luteus]|uniref:Carbohydrate-binding protein n=1 Tax=Luteolibacter luteus TaxID=2728835 RepID=A0A858RKW6_9BACT|nr:PQQ-dependent sugar dehydrogenase [Luteolibacter luteus]QJE97098.1 carbohydrate-binding protein [Luteolibacter luteus]
MKTPSALFSLLLLTQPHALSADGPVPPDYRFKVESLLEGMPQPMQMQFAPDGRLFFNEIAGVVKIFDPKDRSVKEVGKLEVTNAMENGLLGMALDPGFAENHWIYLLHSAPDFDGQTLSRFEVKDDKLDKDSRKDLLKIPEQRKECCHHAGALRFGPDGMLYISTGDNTNPFQSDGFSPLDERDGRNPWDAQKSAGNTNDLRGKILRIRPKADGSYEIPEGNLFRKGTPDTRPEIYAMGFRNPWRFSIDPADGALYVGDVGPDSGETREDRGPNGFDTLNRITKPGNYGWPYSRGKELYNDFDFTANKAGKAFDMKGPTNDSPNNTGMKKLPAVQSPLVWYPGRPTPDFPLIGGGGRTACGGPAFHYDPKFRQSGGFPEYYDRSIIFYDWQRPFIVWLRMDARGNLEKMEPFTNAVRLAQGADDDSGRFQIKRPVDMCFGKDGALYVMDYGETWGANKDARLVRISFQWGNLAPVAKIEANNTRGPEPLAVSLSAEGSKDYEGDTLAYEWRLQPGDKVIGKAKEAKVTLSTAGNYTAELTVKDTKGGTAKSSVNLVVGNHAPEVHIVAPADGTFVTPGQKLRYEIEVKDVEDGSSKDKPDEIGYRTLVNASWEAGDDASGVESGLALMKQNDCFNCHSVDQKLVGPPLLDIANRYRGKSEAIAPAAERVLKGSSGVWGEVGMLPHPQINPDEANLMVRWIFSLEPGKAAPAVNRGLTGELTVPNERRLRGGQLEASYTDAGKGTVGSLGSSASIRLLPRLLQAESGKVQGAKVLSGSGAQGQFIGSIDHGHRLDLGKLQLDDSVSLTARVSSGGQGGVIEFRDGSASGRLVAKLEVKSTGAWDKWEEVTAPLEVKGPVDLVAVFVNPGKGGIMNLDWVRFNEK